MSDADVLGAGTGAGPTGPSFRPEPAAFVPGAQWVNLVSGSLSISSAIAVPDVTFLRPAAGNNGVVGPQTGAVVFLAGLAEVKDGGQRVLIWDDNSVLADNGVNVFNPWVVTGTPGRWRRFGDNASVSVPLSAGVALTTLTLTQVASIVIAPGDWDVYGTAQFSMSSPGILTGMTGMLATSSAAFNFDDGSLGKSRVSPGVAGVHIRQALPIGPLPVLNTTFTPMNLYVMAEFGSGSVIGYGNIYIRKAL